jgi:hypothetical protein
MTLLAFYAAIGSITAPAVLLLIVASHRAGVFRIEPWRAVAYALWAGVVWPVAAWRFVR